MKKKLITLLLALTIISASALSFADYTELKLHRLYYDTETKLFTTLALWDENRQLKLEFAYMDDIVYYFVYKNAKYYYDYEKDLLLITTWDDEIIYQEYECGRGK
jgi:hypothetical protein